MSSAEVGEAREPAEPEPDRREQHVEGDHRGTEDRPPHRPAPEGHRFLGGGHGLQYPVVGTTWFVRAFAATAAVNSVLAAALALPSAESARAACPYQAQVITYSPRGWQPLRQGLREQQDPLDTTKMFVSLELYDGCTAAKACSPTGAYTWCAAQFPGVAFNPGWKSFETW